VNPFDPDSSDAQPDEAHLPAETRAEFVNTQRDSISPAETDTPAEPGPLPPVPPLLRWRDLIILILFYLGVGAVLFRFGLDIGSAVLHTTPAALQKLSAPYVAVVAISQALLSVVTLAFLWLLVRSRSTAPFWPAIGWRALPATAPRAPLAVRYMLGGVALAIVIQVASFYLGAKSEVPMEDFFRDRPSVLMMAALGILVAPVIEETLFRGCIYPVIARTWGMPAGVILTGVLFGMAHSLQLAGAWSQVALLSIVGVLLTYVRARTGTVLASYCIHFGYNTFLFAAFFFATGGLRYFPGS
jgi:CAAX protease family protein